jgi:hypothetical protein
LLLVLFLLLLLLSLLLLAFCSFRFLLLPPASACFLHPSVVTMSVKDSLKAMFEAIAAGVV